jgi:DNA-binding transcriptional ArsR family regulator
MAPSQNRAAFDIPSGGGDTDLSVIGAALADRGRCKILLALADGRALPASVLADEAGVSAATASQHLRRLCEAGLLTVGRAGRFRYYRLAGEEVGRLIEHVARLAPRQQIRSLREGTRAHAIRLARCCYNHVAGRLGVALTDSLIDHGYLTGSDRTTSVNRRALGPVTREVLEEATYQLTRPGRSALAGLGVELPTADGVRCCVDWTEQRHHVAGPLGRGLLDALVANGWIRRAERSRALLLTEQGKSALQRHFDLTWPPPFGVGGRTDNDNPSSTPSRSSAPSSASSATPRREHR